MRRRAIVSSRLARAERLRAGRKPPWEAVLEMVSWHEISRLEGKLADLYEKRDAGRGRSFSTRRGTRAR